MAALHPDVHKVETAILELTNAFRAENKLAALAVAPKLTRAARAYAEFLAKNNLFSHAADGRRPEQRAEAAGYAHCSIAENLAMERDARGFDAGNLALRTVAGWINSPVHKRNLLDAGATEIGIAVARSATPAPTYISVQVFGRPHSLNVEWRIVNATDIKLGYTFGGHTRDLPAGQSLRHGECRSGEIRVTRPGGLLSPATEIGRYQARGGLTLTLRKNAAGDVVVDVAQRDKVRVKAPAAPAARRGEPAPRASARPAAATPASRENAR
jgi:hypothetical protein